MIRRFTSFFDENPLRLAVLLGMTFRLLSAFLAPGYAMHDDHFLVIEAAGSWVGGYDYNAWLPGSPSYDGPEGHSLLYPGIVFLFLTLFKTIGITDPQTQMLTLRLIHAAYSMLIISLVYGIGTRIAGKKQAGTAALLVALLFFMPNFSVRNLVEMVCIPPLLAASLFTLDGVSKRHSGWFLIAGLFMGLAMGLRYQTALFALGYGILLLFTQPFRFTLSFTAAALFAFFLTQLPDLFIHGYLLAELQEYIAYNLQARNEYLTGAWYTYFLTIAGLLIPPISLLLVFGFVKESRRWPWLFWPPVLFLVFHSIFPNKQERFILPILPYLVVLGYAGWARFRQTSSFWKARAGLLRGFWVFWWIVNSAALLVFSTSYAKRSRVEAMYTLFLQTDYQAAILEYSHGNYTMLPQFYSGSWVQPLRVAKTDDLPEVRKQALDRPDDARPNYVIFMGDKDIEYRIDTFQQTVANVQPVAVTSPAYLDIWLNKLNPHNKIERYHIYKVTAYQGDLLK